MTYCFFSTSINPALVRSLPVTACLKALMVSDAIRRLGVFDGLADAGFSVPGASPLGTSREEGLGIKLLDRLMVLRGSRGGSIEA